MDSNSSTGATKRFDGAGEDASRRYWKWRKWAKAYLTLLEAKGTPKEAHGSALFCLLDGPAELALQGLNIEDLCVVNGADRLFSCLDERFPDLETHDKIGESLDDVFRLRVDKGERTATYTGRCRELFEKAAREGIELPDVARGYLMLRGARLGPERKAIVLAAAGQSYTERNVAQALRSTFPVNLGVTKEFVHVMDDCDEPVMPLEEQSTTDVHSAEIDALITNFETLSNTTEESCPIDEEEAVRTLVTWKESRQNLNVVKRDRNFSQNSNPQTPAPDIEQIRRRTRCFRCRRVGHFSKDCPERLQKKQVSQAKVLVTKDDLSVRRQSKPLDELLLEIEQLSRERVLRDSVEPDDEEETCLLLHEPGKAIIDTGCGRCVIGALTLEAHQSVMGDQAKDIVWHHDAPSVVFYYGNGTKDRSIGIIDLPCVIGGQNMQIKMHVVPGEVPCLLSKGWLKENGAVLNTSSEELLLTKKQITTPMSEGPSGHFELDLCSRKKDFGEGRTGTLRPSSVLNRDQDSRVSPNTPSRALVTCWKVMTPRCSLFLQNSVL